MLAKCANPACGTPFRHLEEGKLFQVEDERSPEQGKPFSLRKRRQCVERYWLCDQCASQFTLAVENGGGVVPVPLPSRRIADYLSRPATGYALATQTN